MQDFRTTVKITDKKEVIDADGALQFTLSIVPDDIGVSGYLSLITISEQESEFLGTGDTFDLVLTPRPESS